MVLAVAAVAGCLPHIGGPRTGDALDQVYGTLFGIAPMPPGSRVGWLGLFLHNVSDAPIFLEEVQPNGVGVGTVIRVVKMQASPNLGYQGGVHGIPGGIYVTDPPVMRLGGVCHRPKLLPLEGFRLSPGQEMRVWIVIEAVGPGRFRVPSHTVTYRQHGITYQQVVPVGYESAVEVGAAPLPIPPWERRCLDLTTRLP